MSHESRVQDLIYARCANAIAEVGPDRESLFLARLALLLFEKVDEPTDCFNAIEDALRNIPVPSLSAIR